MAEERLQKIIARSGLCSRRDADRLVAEGRVRVDGQVAEPGEKVDWSKVHIKVDGKTVRAPEVARYFLLYKPREVMTTCDDPEGRKTVLDLVRPVVRERVYPVGRLDYHSEGLLLLTNDGELAARVAHPRHGVVREYMVKIRGDLTRGEYDKLMAGTSIDGRHVKPQLAQREKMGRGGTTTWWRIEVTEGRTHEVRELFFRAGHHVQRLRRTAIGPLRDNTLKPGEFRTLSENELTTLRKVTEPTKKAKPGRPRRAPAKNRGRRQSVERKSPPKKR
ncbi:MAG: pseudouridine synthase [Acidobacteriota bacterium]|nr:pseudouridine synthase [Acidobacteriota bacterium]